MVAELAEEKELFDIAYILKDTNYGLELFDDKERDWLNDRIFEKNGKPYSQCVVREKDIQLKPEEVVRQLYAHRLLEEYEYPKNRLKFEHAVKFGRETKSADIVIFDKERPTVEYILIEVKKPKLKDGKDQLRSYCNATGAPIGVWLNGGQLSHYHRKDPNYFEPLTTLPNANQSLQDVLNERFTWKELILEDEVINKNKSLKTIILDMEDEVLANAGVDVFEEVFKLIFTKLFDEVQSRDDKKYVDKIVKKKLSPDEIGDYEKVKEVVKSIDDEDMERLLEFRNSGQSEGELKKKIQALFDKAKKKWTGVFADDSQIQLSPSHLSVCVSSLQNIKLFNSNLQVIDEAFEYLIGKSAKGEKGQFFTPRHVIDMCVKMLNPQKGESMIDTASGSCGFPVHTIFHFTGHLFTNAEIPQEEIDNVLKVFAIDFDEKAVRVARTLNLIAGDGHTNVLHLNTLDYERWNETIKDREWLKTYGKGLERLEQYGTDKDYKEFNFDILMANPPFAGDIKESRIIHKYDFGFNDKGKHRKKVGRDILFIERNLDFLRPGGRTAIVLPQGRFNNTSDKFIRDYISEKARILAVVGLEVNTFKPHTGTKTSVLFLQKWNDDKSDPRYYCPKVEDYPIFFAVSEKPGKDNSGEYIYVKKEDGTLKLDHHGHHIIDHDLHNHNDERPDGIAEAFVEWAKAEKFGFVG